MPRQRQVSAPAGRRARSAIAARRESEDAALGRALAARAVPARDRWRRPTAGSTSGAARRGTPVASNNEAELLGVLEPLGFEAIDPGRPGAGRTGARLRRGGVRRRPARCRPDQPGLRAARRGGGRAVRRATTSTSASGRWRRPWRACAIGTWSVTAPRPGPGGTAGWPPTSRSTPHRSDASWPSCFGAAVCRKGADAEGQPCHKACKVGPAILVPPVMSLRTEGGDKVAETAPYGAINADRRARLLGASRVRRS